MNYLKILFSALCIASNFCMPAAHGFTLTFSDNQLTAVVAGVFPQQRQFEDIVFTFSGPRVRTSAIKEEITVNVTVLAKQGEQHLLANAEISGQLAYHSQLSQLQIKQPVLDEIEILDNQSVLSPSLVTGVKRLEGKRFPVILLVDFEQLDLAAFGLSKPKRIDITPRGLLIEI